MGKLFYYLFNLIRDDFFSKKTRILVLHSGGLQGLTGFNFKY
jgi:1-aminocyclopropane-1-carboxylate deaminase/D-cysteine desulfhydrase-like pyridoxal-dependent ACC family enzyme